MLTYRTILFWLPLVIGGIAFLALRRTLDSPNRPDLCSPAPAM